MCNVTNLSTKPSAVKRVARCAAVRGNLWANPPIGKLIFHPFGGMKGVFGHLARLEAFRRKIKSSCTLC
jgi:hypothetical protein